MDKKVLLFVLFLVVLLTTLVAVHHYVEPEDEPLVSEKSKEPSDDTSDVMKLFKKNLH